MNQYTWGSTWLVEKFFDGLLVQKITFGDGNRWGKKLAEPIIRKNKGVNLVAAT
jgi:hypothetical protein